MLNIPDIVGWTPLHIACYYKRPDVILLLLKNGAGLFTRDREGITPLDLVFDDGDCLQVINNFLALKKDMTEKTQLQSDSSIYSFNPKNNLKRFYYRKFVKSKAGNFSSGNIAEDMERAGDTQKKILSNYKFIPKKHKFYHNYIKNNIDFNVKDDLVKESISSNTTSFKMYKMKTVQEYDYLNSPREEDTLQKKNTLIRVKNEYNKLNKQKQHQSYKSESLIKGPPIFPQVKPFGKVKYSEPEEVKAIEYDTILQNDKAIQKLHDLYLASDVSQDDESFIFDMRGGRSNELGTTISNKQRNRSYIINCDERDKSTIGDNNNDDTICMNNDDSFSLSEKQPYYNYNINDAILYNVINTKILDKPETDHFLTKIKLDEIFFKVYGCTENEFDDLVYFLIDIDYKFSLLLWLNVYQIENSQEKLLTYLRRSNINNNVLGKFLSRGRDSTFNVSNCYFNSFELDRVNLRDSLKRCLKSI
jgi:hypothetical protein